MKQLEYYKWGTQ